MRKSEIGAGGCRLGLVVRLGGGAGYSDLGCIGKRCFAGVGCIAAVGAGAAELGTAAGVAGYKLDWAQVVVAVEAADIAAAVGADRRLGLVGLD